MPKIVPSDSDPERLRRVVFVDVEPGPRAELGRGFEAAGFDVEDLELCVKADNEHGRECRAPAAGRVWRTLLEIMRRRRDQERPIDALVLGYWFLRESGARGLTSSWGLECPPGCSRMWEISPDLVIVLVEKDLAAVRCYHLAPAVEQIAARTPDAVVQAVERRLEERLERAYPSTQWSSGEVN